MRYSASALPEFCGFSHVLRRRIPPTENMTIACGKGSAFHSAVEAIGQGRPRPDNLSKEVGSWVDRLFAQWSPPVGAVFEDAVGLSPGGKYVPVLEPEPHRYAPVDPTAELLTAGRADLVCFEGSTVHVIDWKTGARVSKEPGKCLQLLALGFAAADRAGSPSFRVSLYHARTGEFHTSDVIDLDSELAAERWSWVVRAAEMDESPRPGWWCRSRCFVRSHCHAYIERTI